MMELICLDVQMFLPLCIFGVIGIFWVIMFFWSYFRIWKDGGIK